MKQITEAEWEEFKSLRKENVKIKNTLILRERFYQIWLCKMLAGWRKFNWQDGKTLREIFDDLTDVLYNLQLDPALNTEDFEEAARAQVQAVRPE